MSRRLSAETAWALAVLLIGFALQLNDGLYTTPGLFLLSIAAVLGLAGLILSRAPLARRSSAEAPSSVPAWSRFTKLAVGGLAINLYLLWTSPAGIYVHEL